MLLPTAARFMLSGTVQCQVCRKPQRVKCQRVQRIHFVCNIFQRDAAHSANGIRKIPVHHVRINSDCLKNLRALIRLNRGNAHFGCNLDNAVQYRIIVIVHRGVIILVEHSIVDQLLDGFLRQIGIHRTRAIADQRCKIMYFPRLRRLDNQRDTGPLLRANQMFLHRGHRKQRRNCNMVLVHTAV